MQYKRSINIELYESEVQYPSNFDQATTPAPAKIGRPQLGTLNRDIVLAQFVVNLEEADIIRQRAAATGLPAAVFLRQLGLKQIGYLQHAFFQSGTLQKKKRILNFSVIRFFLLN